MPKNENVQMLVTLPGGLTYGKLVIACKEAGVPISCELAPHPKGQPAGPDLYRAWGNDPKPVALLITEANRLLERAFKYIREGQSDSATLPLNMARAHAVAATWLRCELKGEFKGHRAELEAEKKAKAKKK
jgi:hypothetical protein